MATSSKLKRGPGPGQDWRMEHLDIYHPDNESNARWVTWRRAFRLNRALQRLKEMYCTQTYGRRAYTYRIRNIETEEIIPGEIFDG